MRTIFRFCTFLATFLLHLSLFSQQVAKKLDIPSGEFPDPYPGLPRPDKIGFLEFRPSNYNEVSKHPLIIFLHGAGERGNGVEDINSVATWGPPMYCAQANVNSTILGQFIVLSPQLSTSYGYWPTFYVKQMIEYAKANLKIDPDRIYLTGLSLGGGGVWRTITESATQASIFAAAAPVCGTYNGSPTNDENYISRDFCGTIGAAHLPIWNFHGMADNVVLPEQSQAAESKLKACSPPVTPAPKFTYYQYNGHDAWNDAYSLDHITKEINENGVVSTFTFTQNLYEWFLSHTRSAASTPSCTTNTLPTNGSTINTSTTATLTWNAATGATSYEVYMWAGATASTTPKANVTTPSYDATGLSPATTYSWYVVPKNTTGSAIGCDANKTTTFITSPNQPPTANAGPNITISANNFSLDGSASTDPDGTIVEWYWTKISGNQVTWENDNQFESPKNITGLTPGNYTFQLQVKDNKGATGYATKTITVTSSSTPACVTNTAPTDGAVLTTSTTATLSWSAADNATSYDVYLWTGATAPATATANVPITTYDATGLTAGTVYNWYVAPKNAEGGAAGCINNKTTFITYGNQLPIANPGPNLIIYLPNGSTSRSASLNGSDSYDPDGSIEAYYWVQVDGPTPSFIADQASPSGITTVSNLVQGIYHFVLHVRDNNHVVKVSNVKTVEVRASSPTNVPPHAVQGRDLTITLPGNAVLNGSTSYDPDGSIEAYYWVQVEGPNASIIADQSAASGVTTASNLIPGTYYFVLHVRDNNHVVAVSAQKKVTVTAAPSARVIISPTTTEATKDAGRLRIYPNPVTASTASIEINSVSKGSKTISMYSLTGVLVRRYNWQTIKGKNIFSLKNISGLTAGVYMVDIRDEHGKSIGNLRFIKL